MFTINMSSITPLHPRVELRGREAFQKCRDRIDDLRGFFLVRPVAFVEAGKKPEARATSAKAVGLY
jgi:hypothetical protein